ncbi:MAG: hypothetical protein ABIO70_26665 [Pseudomonadota bacterium]
MPPIIDVHTHVFNSRDYAVLRFSLAHVEGMLGEARTALLEAIYEKLERGQEGKRSLLPERASDLHEDLFYDLARQGAKEFQGKYRYDPAEVGTPGYWTVEDRERKGGEPTGWGESISGFSVLGFLHYCWLILTHSTEGLIRELIKEAGGQDTPPVQLFVTHIVDMWTAFRDDVALLGRDTLEQAAAMAEVTSSPDTDLTGRTLAFMAFDPNGAITETNGVWKVRHDALADLTTAVEKHGCIGVKLYPLMGFRPSGNAQAIGSDGQPLGDARGAACDAALERLYQFCVEQELPIVSHTRWEGAWSCPGARDNTNPAFWRPVPGGPLPPAGGSRPPRRRRVPHGRRSLWLGGDRGEAHGELERRLHRHRRPYPRPPRGRDRGLPGQPPGLAGGAPQAGPAPDVRLRLARHAHVHPQARGLLPHRAAAPGAPAHRAGAGLPRGHRPELLCWQVLAPGAKGWRLEAGDRRGRRETGDRRR